MSKKHTDTEKACAYCEYATKTIHEDKMLCEKKGIVSSDFKCRKFVYDLQKHAPAKKYILIEK